MASKQSERIRLWGIVQGVGFRPFVAKTAKKLKMKGQVLNTGGLVEIIVTDYREQTDRFIETLVREKPAPAEIVHIKRESVPFREFDDFTIIKSRSGNDEAAMVPADLAICPQCLKELYTEDNPRYLHPFISCMVCGPRYTIMDRIPYDRENTSMVDFPMCEFCEKQYTDISDRRYHAQTISCHDCGPQLMWKGSISPEKTDDLSILDHGAGILKNGGVIAFKSVGGYNLAADPFNEDAVARLRKIKNREAKPFAVMFRSLDQIKEYCYVNDTEARLLQSSARPIILLEHRATDSPEIRKSRFIGSFLPSFAAQYLLLDRISPLIFTSANLSDMPMIKDDDEIFGLMDKRRDISGVIYNKRRILVRADDSVARAIDGQPQMIRRSKGYAPVPLYVESAGGGRASVLAAGSQLKNSFALTKGPFVYMSQFFGDMDTIENQRIYEENLERLKGFLRIEPAMVACDMHPLYFTTSFSEKYAEDNGLPLVRVQHHHAHVASVMAENRLQGKVIGLSFDGTGYGTDGCIWGGEVLLCENGGFQRLAHLKYVNMTGGDGSVKDASRSALSYIHAWDSGAMNSRGSDDNISVDISDIIEYGEKRLKALPHASLTLKALSSGINTVKSSSMGRLFDCVASLLGIKDYNDYEGQCAIMLEDAAASALKNPGADRKCDLALSFHKRIIDAAVYQCRRARELTGAGQVALTGGTFQNKILMEGLLEVLREEGFSPYYNISVSPNDGGIALGQAYIAMNTL